MAVCLRGILGTRGLSLTSLRPVFPSTHIISPPKVLLPCPMTSPTTLLVMRQMSGQRKFIIQASRFTWRRFKSDIHFFIMLAVIPLTIITTWFNLVVGPAELAEIPEGYIPREHEYYKHPVSRWLIRNFQQHPQKGYEQMLQVIFALLNNHYHSFHYILCHKVCSFVWKTLKKNLFRLEIIWESNNIQSFDRLIDWLVDWLIDWLVDWLIDYSFSQNMYEEADEIRIRRLNAKVIALQAERMDYQGYLHMKADQIRLIEKHREHVETQFDEVMSGQITSDWSGTHHASKTSMASGLEIEFVQCLRISLELRIEIPAWIHHAGFFSKIPTCSRLRSSSIWPCAAGLVCGSLFVLKKVCYFAENSAFLLFTLCLLYKSAIKKTISGPFYFSS